MIWLRDDVQVTTDTDPRVMIDTAVHVSGDNVTSSLTIRNLMLSDDADYYCLAEPTNDSEIAHLTVEREFSQCLVAF